MKDVRKSFLAMVTVAVLAATVPYFSEAQQQQQNTARAWFDEALRGGIADQTAFDEWVEAFDQAGLPEYGFWLGSITPGTAR